MIPSFPGRNCKKKSYPQITQITQIREKGNKSKGLLDPVKKCT